MAHPADNTDISDIVNLVVSRTGLSEESARNVLSLSGDILVITHADELSAETLDAIEALLVYEHSERAAFAPAVMRIGGEGHVPGLFEKIRDAVRLMARRFRAVQLSMIPAVSEEKRAELLEFICIEIDE